MPGQTAALAAPAAVVILKVVVLQATRKKIQLPRRNWDPSHIIHATALLCGKNSMLEEAGWCFHTLLQHSEWLRAVVPNTRKL